MRILFVSLSVLCFLTLNACDSSSNDQVSEITIGLAAPLTGTLARTGQDMRVAAEMAVALANEGLTEGRPSFRLSVEDSKSTTEGTEDAFRSLISSGVAFILVVQLVFVDAVGGQLPRQIHGILGADAVLSAHQ